MSLGKLAFLTESTARTASACRCSYFRDDFAEFAQFFCWTIESRALLLRWDAVHSQMHPERGNWPQEFSDSVRAAGPTVLSDWETGKVCTHRFLEMAEKDEHLNTLPQSRRIARNTLDVFLIGLLSEGYGLATHFESRKPLKVPYQAVSPLLAAVQARVEEDYPLFL